MSYKLKMLGAGLPGVIPHTGTNPLVQGVHRPEPTVSPLRRGILSDPTPLRANREPARACDSPCWHPSQIARHRGAAVHMLGPQSELA